MYTSIKSYVFRDAVYYFSKRKSCNSKINILFGSLKNSEISNMTTGREDIIYEDTWTIIAKASVSTIKNVYSWRLFFFFFFFF